MSGPYQIKCPEPGCTWKSREFEKYTGELASKVDAGLHYVETHGGRIPEEEEFGNEQCPNCFDVNGLNGTVSCSECGFVPEKVRA